MLCIKSLFFVVVGVRICYKKIRDAPLLRALRVINKLINTCARAIRTHARINNSLITLSVYKRASRIFYTCSTQQAAVINTPAQSQLCHLEGGSLSRSGALITA